jgi:hypothetical protein
MTGASDARFAHRSEALFAGLCRTGARASPADMHATRLEPEEIAVALVLDARELIERGWCQSAPAVNQTGRAVEPTSTHARKWSALGALIAAYRSYAPYETAARSAFALARRALAHRGGDLIAWNDEPSRTRTEVLAAFQSAVEGLSR